MGLGGVLALGLLVLGLVMGLVKERGFGSVVIGAVFVAVGVEALVVDVGNFRHYWVLMGVVGGGCFGIPCERDRGPSRCSG